jgi:uncharacterized protein (DUF1786 family)
MEILLVLAGVIVGGGAGVFATRRFWPRIVYTIDASKVFPDTRFRIVAYTNRGAAARQFFERIKPVNDAVIEFYDGEHRRGRKEAK